jgi:hypothetical protein
LKPGSALSPLPPQRQLLLLLDWPSKRGQERQRWAWSSSTLYFIAKICFYFYFLFIYPLFGGRSGMTALHTKIKLKIWLITVAIAQGKLL